MDSKIIKLLDDLMCNIYDWLYENDTPEALACESWAADIFDNIGDTGEMRELVTAVVNYRHDLITSDREAAAFVLAAQALGYQF